MSKRGLSPVIATVLLVSIALILAVIIFLWAKSFLGEQAQKFGEPVERACSEVNFEAEAIWNAGQLEINIVNRGKVPLYGIEVRERDEQGGAIRSVGKFSREMIRNGETEAIPVNSNDPIDSGMILNIVPIIIGETSTGRPQHICEVEFGQEVEVPTI